VNVCACSSRGWHEAIVVVVVAAAAAGSRRRLSFSLPLSLALVNGD
jgi:hypothetical protein